MGKNSKGKECGKGIYQRKDGTFHARFKDRFGKEHGKYFKTLAEARNWLEEAKYRDKHGNVFVPAGEMTVDEWFEFWIENIVGDLAPNTRRNYRERYTHNIHVNTAKPCNRKALKTLDFLKEIEENEIRDRYI